MQRTLLTTMRERAQAAADSMTGLLGPSLQRTYAAYGRAATDPVVVAFLADPSADPAQVSGRFREVLGDGDEHVELWTATGRRVFAWSSDPSRVRPAGVAAPSTTSVKIIESGGRVLVQT